MAAKEVKTLSDTKPAKKHHPPHIHKGKPNRLLWLKIVVGLLMVSLMLLIGFEWWYRARTIPGLSVARKNVSGLNGPELQMWLDEELRAYLGQWPITVGFEANLWEISYSDEVVEFDVERTIAEAIDTGKDAHLLKRIRQQWIVLQDGKDVPVRLQVNQAWLDTVTASMSAQLDVEPVEPRIELIETATGSGVIVHQGEKGRRFNKELFEQQLLESWSHLQPVDPLLPVEDVVQLASAEELESAEQRAMSLLGKELVLTYTLDEVDQEWLVEEENLLAWVGFEEAYQEDSIEMYLNEVAEAVNRPAQNAKFEFNQELGKVEEFVPAKDGVVVDILETKQAIVDALVYLERESETEPVLMSLETSQPEITMSDVNDLGIEELLGQGVSTYYGSIPSRVHNVGLAAQRLTGTLIKPGEEFSFNSAVGEISGTTGYQQAYVIQNGRTEMGDGGGVCQDSTTVFRAALDAGLPITERRAHSYRVGYYEQNAKPGLDATVFSPTTDLQFLNDTPAYILIQTEIDEPNRTLVVNIYGTSDGRESAISNHVVWDISPPLPDEFIDDPTLPAGEIKQIDWKAGGAKAKFDYLVTRKGEVVFEKNFYSAYKPWSAKFLRGTGGV